MMPIKFTNPEVTKLTIYGVSLFIVEKTVMRKCFYFTKFTHEFVILFQLQNLLVPQMLSNK